jgi:hypothetical protein
MRLAFALAIVTTVVSANAGVVPQQRGNACAAVWDLGPVDAVPGTTRRQPWTVTCVDGDPRCDGDGFVDGVCRVAVQVCVEQAIEGCTPKRPTRLRLPKSTATRLPGLVLPSLRGGAACGPTTTLDVPASSTDEPTLLTLLSRTRRTAGRSRVAVQCLPGTDTSSVCPNRLPGLASRARLSWQRAYSDVDLGYSGEAHNFAFVQGGLDLCLRDCDDVTTTTCQLSAARAPRPLPPLPLLVNGVPLCVALRVATPPAGTYDLASGALDLNTTVAATFHVLQPQTDVCPRCSGDGAGGSTGTCRGGANAGAPCIVDARTMLVGGAGDTEYQLSGDCLPSGPGVSAADIPLALSTGERRLDGSKPCPDQGVDDACPGATTCSLDCSATSASKGGRNQTCCSDDPWRPCFPTAPDASGQAIVRTGTPAVAFRTLVTEVFPKIGNGVLAYVGCSPRIRDATTDGVIGLGGPTAALLPFQLTLTDD